MADGFDQVTRRHIHKLLKPQKSYVVSIYLPTEKAIGADVRQNQVRFKNLLNQARHHLLEVGVRRTDVDKQLQSTERLVDDDDFWHNQSHGLAVFISPKNTSTFRLPVSFIEVSVVAKRYHLKQLLQAADNDQSYHVLAISPNRVKLFETSRIGTRHTPVDNLPGNITEALGIDDNERNVQHHFGDSTTTTSGHSAIYHSHGGAKDQQDSDQIRFVRQIAGSLGCKLRNSKKPLVVAGVDEVVAIFRDTYPHDHLHEFHIHGNFDDVEEHQLHEHLLPLLETELRTKTENDYRRYREMTESRPELTAEIIDDIVLLAQQGRVDTLLVNPQPLCWGDIDGEKIERHEHEQQPGLNDLSDIATAFAINTSSKIGFLQPEIAGEKTPALAILRY